MNSLAIKPSKDSVYIDGVSGRIVSYGSGVSMEGLKELYGYNPLLFTSEINRICSATPFIVCAALIIGKADNEKILSKINSDDVFPWEKVSPIKIFENSELRLYPWSRSEAYKKLVGKWVVTKTMFGSAPSGIAQVNDEYPGMYVVEKEQEEPAIFRIIRNLNTAPINISKIMNPYIKGRIHFRGSLEILDVLESLLKAEMPEGELVHKPLFEQLIRNGIDLSIPHITLTQSNI